MKLDLKIVSLIFLIIGCNTQEPGIYCFNNLYINGTKEGFCVEETNEVNSQLKTYDSLYVQYGISEDYNFRSSENYLTYTIAFANIKPDSNDYDTEVAFYENLITTMKPGSTHELNIYKMGGFAIELWDKNGEYYSSELGLQKYGAQVEIRPVSIYLSGPNTNQYASKMVIQIANTTPIITWNEDNSKFLEVELDDNAVILVDFQQFK